MDEKYNSVKEIIRGFYLEIIATVAFAIIGVIKEWFRRRSINKEKGDFIMADEVVVEKKAFDMNLEGEYLLISVDPNKDGEKLIEIKLHLKEVPDEVLGIFKK